jgi:diguanylate cyclase
VLFCPLRRLGVGFDLTTGGAKIAVTALWPARASSQSSFPCSRLTSRQSGSQRGAWLDGWFRSDGLLSISALLMLVVCRKGVLRGGLASRRLVWLAYTFLGVLLASYIAYEAAFDHAYSSILDGWLVDGFEFAASGLCLARGLSRPRRPMALALGASLFAWSFGDLVLTIESLGGAAPSPPSLVDVFYLGFFPLAYVAIVLYMRGEVRRLASPSWLDAGVAGLGAAALCAAFAFHGIARSVGGSPLGDAVGLAYPVGDLLLLSMVVAGTAVLAGRSKAPWFLLAAGIGLNVVGDTFSLFQSSIGASRVGAVWAATAWPAAILLMSVAVWLPRGAPNPLSSRRPTGFLLPGLAATSSLAILVLGTVHSTNRLAVGLATATLALVGVRLALSVRGLRTVTLERQRLSVTDHLTGLWNRRHLFNVLDAFFAHGDDAQRRRLAFLFIDLNQFKEVNDSFGHPAGDELLKQLGARLSGSLRSSDLFVRVGGDEFAVVLLDADAEQAMTTARRLTDTLEEPFTLSAVEARIGASIGIALAPDDASDGARLVWCADVAMYRAKIGGTPFALYEPELENENRMRLAEELAAAIREDRLVLHYQPQLDLHSGDIRSVEALVRWPHTRLGLLPPLKFLSLAEEASLIAPLTRWVLKEALAQCAHWRAGGRDITVSVNISATSLSDDDFIALLQDELNRHRLQPDALILEITETSMLTDFQRATATIAKLRDHGIVVSIDDFGAGFTSLAHLNTLPVGELKLDRMFVTDLATTDRERDRNLVRGTIQLGHSLGLRVVAEGVEDKPTLDLLSQLGCDRVQGYFISTPKPANQLNFRPNLPATAIAA